MAKEKMICPFSGSVCVECPIYRGRHYLLCYNRKNQGQTKKADSDQKIRVGFEDSNDVTFGIPSSIELGRGCIRNVEDIVERRDI